MIKPGPKRLDTVQKLQEMNTPITEKNKTPIEFRTINNQNHSLRSSLEKMTINA